MRELVCVAFHRRILYALAAQIKYNRGSASVGNHSTLDILAIEHLRLRVPRPAALQGPLKDACEAEFPKLLDYQ